MLKIEHLSKSFNGRKIVKDLSLDIKSGELFAFLGPNGAGKTTTIKMMSGLLKPDQGKVTINGFDLVSQTLQAKQSFGFIPDQPFVYDRLTPREFLRFMGGLYGMQPKDCDERITNWLERFDLLPFELELIGAFSHGMRQKVAFSAAMLHDPPVLIIDEPMVGLDPKGAVALKSILRERCSRGVAAFVSTHSLDVAEQIADRIGILYHGELVAVGTMDELQQTVQNQNSRLEQIFLEITDQTEPSVLVPVLD